VGHDVTGAVAFLKKSSNIDAHTSAHSLIEANPRQEPMAAPIGLFREAFLHGSFWPTNSTRTMSCQWTCSWPVRRCCMPLTSCFVHR